MITFSNTHCHCPKRVAIERHVIWGRPRPRFSQPPNLSNRRTSSQCSTRMQSRACGVIIEVYWRLSSVIDLILIRDNPRGWCCHINWSINVITMNYAQRAWFVIRSLISLLLQTIVTCCERLSLRSRGSGHAWLGTITLEWNQTQHYWFF
jgi:hypothetical protein